MIFNKNMIKSRKYEQFIVLKSQKYCCCYVYKCWHSEGIMKASGLGLPITISQNLWREKERKCSKKVYIYVYRFENRLVKGKVCNLRFYVHIQDYCQSMCMHILSIQQCSIIRLHFGCYSCALVLLSTFDQNKSEQHTFTLNCFGLESQWGAAVAAMTVGSEEAKGVIRMVQLSENKCIFEGTIDGLPPGKQALCIHETGDISDQCTR